MFKECVVWRKEIRELWNTVGEISGIDRRESRGVRRGRRGFVLGEAGERRWIRRLGNASARGLMSDKRFTEVVLDFLRNTKVGKIKEEGCL